MPFDRPLQFGAASARARSIAAGPVEDLAIAIAPQGRRLRLDLDANPDAYDATRLAALHARLGAALTALAAQRDLPLRQVLGRAPLSWVFGPALPHPPQALLDALRAQAARYPGRPAIEQDGLVLTYAALLDQVRALAGRLAAAGVGAQDRVALLLERHPTTIVAMLAVLWAGAGYVPLDPHGPPLRIATVLADARPALIVTTRAHAHAAQGAPQLLLDQAGAAPPMPEPLAVDAHALAYVIYTSGSTGRPNGVMIGRAALAHFVAGASLRYAIGEADRVLQFAPLHFDASVEEIYLPLCAGATLVLRNEAMLESLPCFVAACAERRISVLDLPTAFWHELAYCLSQGQSTLPDSLRLVIIGGEAALAERLARWRASVAPGVTLLNTYGPTETTVIVTSAELHGGATVPIGLPLPGTDVVLVDADLRPVPVGVEGELCVLGPALASGYFGQPELSARRFITIEGRRAYRSGDRAVLDGELRFLGRLDHELKLSGQRIDPVEIEAALLDYPGLRETAVVAIGKRLHAFYCAQGTPASADALRAHLAERITAAALPAGYHSCTRLPRNHNGKIDRAALRAMAAHAHVPASDGASALELAVIAVWREVLGVNAVAPEDDFFALGGRSLQAIQAANRLAIALGREVPASALFRHPTVAALARNLEALTGPAPYGPGHAPPPGASGSAFAPLLTIQAGSAAHSEPALFCIHPAEGLAWCYLGLARHLPHTPIYGLQARGISGAAPEHIDELVDDYLAQIRSVQPHGPYRLLGWSSGGGVAHALALRLRALGQAVPLLAMMDAYPSDIWEGKPPARRRDALLALLDVVGAAALDANGQPLDEDALLALLRAPGSSLATASAAELARLVEMALHTMRLYRELRHERFDGDLLFFHASERSAQAPDWRGWAPYVAGQITCIDIDSTHNTMSRPAPLAHIGRELAHALASTWATDPIEEIL